MSSISGHVIPTEGLRNFRYYYFVRRCGKEVVLTVFKYNFLHGHTKTIYEVLQDAGVTFGKKSRFNDTEFKKLSSNVPPETLDITALYKIFLVLWEKNVNNPGDTLKRLLKEIKDERNAVSHEEGYISESDLVTKLVAFGSKLETCLDEAFALYAHMGANFDPLKNEIQVATANIRDKIREKYDPSNSDHLKRFQSEIEDFKDHLHEYLQEISKGEMKHVYADLCKILPFDWLSQYGVTEPSDIMIPLKLELQKEFHPTIANEDPVIIGQKEILNFKEPRKNNPKVVILTGNAGSGKTTLLSCVVENWYKDTSDMTDLSTFQTLLYMQFRSRDHDSFESYLSELLQRTVCDFSIDFVKASILHSKCLILCDGYDEANDSSKKVFKDILKLKCREMKIVITTRPVSTKELSSVVNKERLVRINLNILGVSRENVELHIRMVTNYLKTDHKERNEAVNEILESFKLMDYRMSQILRNPLWLNMYLLLYNECPHLKGNINTVTSLYMHLKEHNKERLIEKLEIEEEAASEFDAFYREWSFRYHLQQKYELSQEDAEVFRAKCKDLDLNFDLLMSSYFNVKHAKKGINVVKVYCYRHRSEQEFTSATVICDAISKYYDENKSDLLKLDEGDKNLIHRALMSSSFKSEMHKFQQQNKNQTESQEETDNIYLIGIMTFITGILFNTNKKDLLCDVIGDFLDLHWKLEGGSFGHFIGDTDSLIEHCVETNNEQEILIAVINKLKSIGGGTMNRLKCQNTHCLSSLPLIITALRPELSELALGDFKNLDELYHLTTILDLASQSSVAVDLSFELGCAEVADKYIEEAKTCVAFRGRLTVSGIQSLPEGCLMSLELRLDMEAVRTLSARLADFQQLTNLFLQLDDSGFEDVSGLSSLNLSEGALVLDLVADYDIVDESSAQRIACIVNSLLPKERKESLFCAFSIKTKFSRHTITGVTVQLIGKLLTVRSLNTISIHGVKHESYEAEKELCDYFRDEGIGFLQFFAAYDL